MNDFERLVQLMESGGVITKILFEEDLEGVMDLRDDPRFEEHWLRVHAVVKEKLASMGVTQRAAVDRIREVAFKQAYGLTQDPEVAGTVSDDLELVAVAAASGLRDGWLNALWLSYRAGRVPRGPLEPKENLPMFS